MASYPAVRAMTARSERTREKVEVMRQEEKTMQRLFVSQVKIIWGLGVCQTWETCDLGLRGKFVRSCCTWTRCRRPCPCRCHGSYGCDRGP